MNKKYDKSGKLYACKLIIGFQIILVFNQRKVEKKNLLKMSHGHDTLKNI